MGLFLSKGKKVPKININILMDNPGFFNVVQIILSRLDQKSLLECRLVCHSWKSQVDQPLFWLKKCDAKGQSKNLHNAWNELIQKIEKNSNLAQEASKCIMKCENVYGLMKNDQKNDLIAAENGMIDIVKILVSHVDNIPTPKPNGWRTIYIAIRFGHIGIVKLLYSRVRKFNDPFPDG